MLERSAWNQKYVLSIISVCVNIWGQKRRKGKLAISPEILSSMSQKPKIFFIFFPMIYFCGLFFSILTTKNELLTRAPESERER